MVSDHNLNNDGPQRFHWLNIFIIIIVTLTIIIKNFNTHLDWRGLFYTQKVSLTIVCGDPNTVLHGTSQRKSEN